MPYQNLIYNGSSDYLSGILGGALLATLGLVAFIIALTFYAYFAFSWMTIGKKLKYKYPWLAWIPFANLSMILQMGRFHWAWVFLVLVPIIGWLALAIMIVIASWRIFEKRKYPGWFSLSLILPQIGGILYLIILGFVAFKDRNKVLFK